MTLDELAEEYLVTASGRRPQDPCGMWCGDQDVTDWASVLIRVRRTVLLTIKRNAGMPWPPDLIQKSALWAMRANRVKSGGNVFHVFGSGTDEVYALVNLAREGVDVLFALQTVIVENGGNVVGPGPLPEPSSSDASTWVIVGAALAVALMIYARR